VRVRDLIILGIVLLLGRAQSQARVKKQEAPTHASFIAAIHKTESSGKMHPPDGDHGKAIGPFQIHYLYWRDAVRNHPELKQRGYQKCRDYSYAIQIVKNYLQRYASSAWKQGNWEILARIHNGGPDGSQEVATLDYWNRVRSKW
jgi:Destabilase